MNKNIQTLYNIATKPQKKIIGLMSGTSLDGLDIALCQISGYGLHTKIIVEQFKTIAYNDDFKQEIKSVFCKQNISLKKLTLLNPWVALQHASMVNETLKSWDIKNESIDLIASHGQTIYHAPKILHRKNKFSNATLQIGDGDHLSVATGIITLSDFRQKNIAAGGQGAPLSAYGDYIFFSKKGENRILLNLGGIANFTLLPDGRDSASIFSTDTGPANTLMDAYINQQLPAVFFDKNAEIAKRGNINNALLAHLKSHPFFAKPFPKTTGPEIFNLAYLQLTKQQTHTQNIGLQNTLATLNKFSADTIADGILKSTHPKKTYKIFVSGGGVHNPLLMQHLKELLPNFCINTTAALHINPNAKEAVLFALLANECVSGNSNYLPKNIAGMPNVSMGKISFPY